VDREGGQGGGRGVEGGERGTYPSPIHKLLHPFRQERIQCRGTEACSEEGKTFPKNLKQSRVN
jgi:hypothetical protein